VLEEQQHQKRIFMKKKSKTSQDEMRAEYDFSKLKNRVKGKYAERYASETNVVVLAPDVARVFKNEKSVNEALRMLVKIANTGASK
jgi:hypothetical protein